MIASKINAKKRKINDGKRAKTASSNSCEKKMCFLKKQRTFSTVYLKSGFRPAWNNHLFKGKFELSHSYDLRFEARDQKWSAFAGFWIWLSGNVFETLTLLTWKKAFSTIKKFYDEIEIFFERKKGKIKTIEDHISNH